jgi:phosphomethylpyrimidine synthase
MREISQDDTPTMFGGEKNPPIFVYDCSGPYSDPAAKIDIRSGLPALRAQWIAERGDTEALADLSSEFGRERAGDKELDELRFPGLHRKPLRAKAGKNVSQMHYARQGIITPEMEYVAIRENNNRRAYIESLRSPRAKWAKKWPPCSAASTPARTSAPASRKKSRRNSCAAKSPAAAPSSPTTSTTRKASR